MIFTDCTYAMQLHCSSHDELLYSLICNATTGPHRTRQDAQLSQRDRAAGCAIVFAKRRRLELRDNILRTLYVYLQPLWYNRPENLSISVKKTQKRLLRRSKSFKVIEVGTNRKPVCDFLLVINSNWHPISNRFGVIAAYCSNFGHFAFSSHPLIGDNVRCSSWAHWKARRTSY